MKAVWAASVRALQRGTSQCGVWVGMGVGGGAGGEAREASLDTGIGTGAKLCSGIGVGVTTGNGEPPKRLSVGSGCAT